MAILTITQQLEAVQAAITAIESGAQSYSVLGRSFSRGDINSLYAREERLRARLDRQTRGGIGVKYGFPES